MTTLTASQARIPSKTFNRVVYNGERIRIRHRSGEAVVLISEKDLALLETIEDLLDLESAEQALAEVKAQYRKPVPWEKVKARLGL